MSELFFPDELQAIQKLRMLVYGPAGVGKTIGLLSALKIPGLQVCVLAIEANAISGIKEAIKIHNIELKENQLIVATVAAPRFADSGSFTENSNDDFYSGIVQKSINFEGIDVKTGKTVKCGSIFTWTTNRCFILDGLTMLEASCTSRGRKVATLEGTIKDARAAFYKAQDALINYVYKVVEQSNCHVLVAGHQTISDEVAVKKHRLDKMINPACGTRSIIDRLNGRFTNVMYARKNKQTNKFVWSVAEEDAYTVARNINLEKCKKLNITLNNLPADLSHEIYDFFGTIANPLC